MCETKESIFISVTLSYYMDFGSFGLLGWGFLFFLGGGVSMIKCFMSSSVLII